MVLGHDASNLLAVAYTHNYESPQNLKLIIWPVEMAWFLSDIISGFVLHICWLHPMTDSVDITVLKGYFSRIQRPLAFIMISEQLYQPDIF